MRPLRLPILLPAAFLSVLLLFTACSDEPSGADGSNDKKSILTSKTWRTTLFTLNGEDASVLHFTTTTFNANGIVTGTRSGGVTDEGTWKFNDDETIIEVRDLGPGYNWTILELTNTSIKFKDDDEEAGSYALKTVWHAVPQ